MADQKNNLLTDDVIANEALRLLKNNLVAANLVYKEYKQTFGKVGDTIRIELPHRVKSASGRVLVKQPMVDQTVPLKIDRQEHVGLEYTMKAMTLDITKFSEKYLKSGMSQIANQIDSSILLTMKNVFHTSGTPGVRPGKFIDFANASAKQTTYGVPNDGMRRAVLNPFTCANLSDEVTKLFKESMVEDAYKNGYKGDVARYSTYDTQNLPTHLVGDYAGTPVIAGAQANGTTLTTSGWAAGVTGLLKAGDVITVAATFGVNPQGYNTTGLLLELVVQADVDSDGGGLATIEVFPSLNDGTATITNADGDTISLAAYQNVTALPQSGAVITVAGDSGKEYEQNYLFHREAIALAMIDIELPRSATVKARAFDPDTELSLSMTQAYDINQHSEITRIDAIWGTKAIYPDLGMRMWGAQFGA